MKNVMICHFLIDKAKYSFSHRLHRFTQIFLLRLAWCGPVPLGLCPSSRHSVPLSILEAMLPMANATD